MNEVKAIEEITKDILAGLYGSIQRAGTETQKYTMLTYKLSKFITVI